MGIRGVRRSSSPCCFNRSNHWSYENCSRGTCSIAYRPLNTCSFRDRATPISSTMLLNCPTGEVYHCVHRVVHHDEVLAITQHCPEAARLYGGYHFSRKVGGIPGSSLAVAYHSSRKTCHDEKVVLVYSIGYRLSGHPLPLRVAIDYLDKWASQAKNTRVPVSKPLEYQAPDQRPASSLSSPRQVQPVWGIALDFAQGHIHAVSSPRAVEQPRRSSPAQCIPPSSFRTHSRGPGGQTHQRSL